MDASTILIPAAPGFFSLVVEPLLFVAAAVAAGGVAAVGAALAIAAGTTPPGPRATQTS